MMGGSAALSVGALQFREHRKVLDIERGEPQPVMLGRGGDDGIRYFNRMARAVVANEYASSYGNVTIDGEWLNQLLEFSKIAFVPLAPNAQV